MNEYMFDINIFNRLLDGSVDLNIFVDKICYATHIQIDEIRATENAERRSKLEKIFSRVVIEELPTQSFILDVSRLDKAYLGNGEKHAQLLESLNRRNKAKSNNVQDALIAETALIRGLTVVTEDHDLHEVITELGGAACGIGNLL